MVSLTASGEGYIGGYEMVGLLPPPSSLLPQHVILIVLIRVLFSIEPFRRLIHTCASVSGVSNIIIVSPMK